MRFFLKKVCSISIICFKVRQRWFQSLFWSVKSYVKTYARPSLNKSLLVIPRLKTKKWNLQHWRAHDLRFRWPKAVLWCDIFLKSYDNARCINDLIHNIWRQQYDLTPCFIQLDLWSLSKANNMKIYSLIARFNVVLSVEGAFRFDDLFQS